MTALVHINGSSFAVHDTDVAGVEIRILEAVRAGGAFLDFLGACNRPIRALISPGSWVWIEVIPQQDEPPDGAAPILDLSFLELEL